MQTPYIMPPGITFSRKFIIAYALNVFTIMEIAGSVTEFTRITGRIRARAATRAEAGTPEPHYYVCSRACRGLSPRRAIAGDPHPR
jgi:hypothetical protein